MNIRPVDGYGSSIAIAVASLPLALVMVDPITDEVTFDVHPDPMVMRDRITKLQADIVSTPGKFTELPIDHNFVDGMYIRRLFIPKGSLIIGHIHKQACINIMEKGDMSVLSETGAARVKAGFVIASPAGMQKVGYAHEDSIFTNIFRTDETDIAKLEIDLVWESYEMMALQIKELPCH